MNGMTRRLLPLLFLALYASACTENTTPTNQPPAKQQMLAHSDKGWELYSWPDGEGWRFSILGGTNRLKTYDEVTASALIATDTVSLQRILDRIPAGDFLTCIGRGWLKSCWGSGYKDLTSPPDSIVESIRRYCNARNLTFQTTG
jgi:hypothetical protein